jgi:hypothetical protein
MRLEVCLNEVGRQASWKQLGHLRSTIGLDWVRQALRRTQAETIRRRKLPHEAVVWLVVGIALFRERSIDAVVKHLELARSSDPPVPSPTGSPISSAAVAQARHRIGSGPLAELFKITAESWTSEFIETNRWRDLQVFAIDGSGLRIADTPANEEFFGRPGSGRSKAAYPQARIVTVLAVGSRLVCDSAIGNQKQGEQSLARDLIERMPDRSVLILDRGFVNHTMFARTMVAGTERHFLCRAKANLVSKRVRILGRNDSLVQINVSAPDRREDPALPETITVRLIQYTIPGFRPATLVTSLLDPERFPRSEIVDLYHKRWEIETAYDEIKTHTLERDETIRSRSPELVLQEIYGILVAYNLLRVAMARAAAIAGVAAARMSFCNSLLEIRDFFSLAADTAPGNLPGLYRRLCSRLALLVLPERRPRRYLRAVKIKMSNYKRKDF